MEPQVGHLPATLGPELLPSVSEWGSLTIIKIYAIIRAVEPRLINQLRTTADAVLQVKNASAATAVDSSKAGSGTPLLVVFAKILGARPCFARPKMVLDAWNRRELVQLQAEVILCARQGLVSLLRLESRVISSLDKLTQRHCKGLVRNLFPVGAWR